jgi:serine/threonine protein kinase
MLNSPSIPAELFGYKVIDRLGEGAASVVYAVMDKSRQVLALKHVVRRAEKDQRFIDQIKQEYDIGSKLDHRNIRAIRLFREKAGWSPLYTGSDISTRFEPLCFGPSHLPPGTRVTPSLPVLPA